MVAGTENLGIGVTATTTQTKQLVPAKAVAKPPRTTLAQVPTNTKQQLQLQQQT